MMPNENYQPWGHYLLLQDQDLSAAVWRHCPGLEHFSCPQSPTFLCFLGKNCGHTVGLEETVFPKVLFSYLSLIFKI